jgi:hypothetical protein
MRRRRKDMADDKTKRGPADRSKISLKEDYEVRYWTKALGVSKAELQKLVKKYGHSSATIRKHLKD